MHLQKQVSSTLFNAFIRNVTCILNPLPLLSCGFQNSQRTAAGAKLRNCDHRLPIRLACGTSSFTVGEVIFHNQADCERARRSGTMLKIINSGHRDSSSTYISGSLGSTQTIKVEELFPYVLYVVYPNSCWSMFLVCTNQHLCVSCFFFPLFLAKQTKISQNSI